MIYSLETRHNPIMSNPVRLIPYKSFFQLLKKLQRECFVHYNIYYYLHGNRTHCNLIFNLQCILYTRLMIIYYAHDDAVI